MRIDLYTRMVLTVIAICLVWLSIGGPSLIAAYAQGKQSGYQAVLIAGWVDAGRTEHALPAPKVVVEGSTGDGLPVDGGRSK